MKDRNNEPRWNPVEHYKNDTVANKYDEVRFSSLSGRIFNYLEKRIIKKCFQDLSPNTTVLDLPCGTGRLAEAILELGLKVHGADVSPEMLEVAKNRLKNFGSHFDTEIINAFKMRQYNPQYEAALCARVLMHFPLDEQVAFLRGVASVVNKRIVINHSLDSPYQRFRRLIKKLLGHPKSVNFPISNTEIKQLLSEAGFVEIKRIRMNALISEAIYIIAERVD